MTSPFHYSAPTPLEYFAALVQSDQHLPLLEAAASLAQDEYPELDVQQVLGQVDQLQARLARRISADAGPLQRLRLLNHFFYRELSFGGNVNNYYDPDNSYLNALLRTRAGIPISLSVLWLELAQGLGLHACGVAFPGHFMVKVRLPQGYAVLDPLSGESLSREELNQRLEPFQRRSGVLADAAPPLGLYLQAAGSRQIIERMLRNLKEIHKAQQDWQRLIAVQNRLVVLLPEVWAELRDRGLAYASLGQADLAAADLKTYLARAQDCWDYEAVSQRLAVLMGTTGTA